jgi:glycosyltransferase involved in cell wall biosynthesis
MKYCRSRDLTVTNKLLQYLLAGLAVVASDTEGQREVAEQAGEAVVLYPSGEPGALASQLNALLGSPERLSRAKAAALTAAEQIFCWERQEPVLLESVTRALGRSACAQG